MAVTSEKHYEARVVSRTQLTHDLFLMRVNAGGPWKHVAGQYATLGVEKEGKRIERAYSICSSPYEGELEFFVETVPQGELTPLLDKLEVGDTLLCRKIAKGRFTLDLKSGRKKHLLLSTVTGVAPYVSYARTIFRDGKNGENGMPGEHQLFCLQGASLPTEFGYREELERYASEVPWLKYVPTVSRPWEDPTWSGETGRVDDLIRKYTDLWELKPAETTVYLCGHPTMIENGRGILKRAGWKKDAMFDEVYFIPGKENAVAE